MAGIPANMDLLKAASRERNEQAERYKAIAKERAGYIKYGQEYALTLWEKLSEYIEDQAQKKKPITISGLVKASGMTKETFNQYRKGNYDHLLYQCMDRHGVDYSMEGKQLEVDGQVILFVRLSDVIKNALLLVEDQLEELCYTKGNPVGAIFALKAKYNWQDTPAEQRNTINNTLVLNKFATLDDAKEAMKRLTE